VRTIAGDPTRPQRSISLIARLAPGVTLKDARTELLARWPGIQSATVPPSLSPAEQQALRSQRIEMESLASGFSTLRRTYGASLVVLIALSLAMVAIGCVNLAGLFLARSLARRQQVAVMLALGASRGRVVQQALVDGVLLSFAGLAPSLPFAWRGASSLPVSLARRALTRRSVTPT
jgi:hypothetical protein